MARQIFPENWPATKIETAKLATSSRNVEETDIVNHHDTHNLLTKIKNIFSVSNYLTITLAAYMSNAPYDVFVDTRANFRLLAPYNFNDILIIPHIIFCRLMELK